MLIACVSVFIGFVSIIMSSFVVFDFLLNVMWLTRTKKI